MKKSLKDEKYIGLQINHAFLRHPKIPCFSKLLWAKKGESERQFQDALGVAKLQRESFDFEYLEKWAEFFGYYRYAKKDDKGIEK